MADVVSAPRSAPEPAAPAPAKGDAAAPPKAARRDAATIDLIELLFFAYRGFTAEPDAALAEIGFGRAHHRVLHFIVRNPGLRVAELLEILRITKQSLARVLKELIEGGFVLQKSGANDRRERLLFATPSGDQLISRLVEGQSARIATALERCGPGADAHVKGFLDGMVTSGDRALIEAIVERRRRVGAPRKPGAGGRR